MALNGDLSLPSYNTKSILLAGALAGKTAYFRNRDGVSSKILKKGKTSVGKPHKKPLERVDKSLDPGRIQLEFGRTRCSRERDHIPNVMHSSDKHEKSLKAQTKARVRNRAETSKVDIPLVFLFTETVLSEVLS